jgi:fido (protein-threonine AMPylation protein)
MSFERSTESLPSGRLSYSHFRAIHRHLFQDVYAWAGKVRTVRISKGESTFCYPEHIDQEMAKLFKALRQTGHLRGTSPQDFAKQAAHFLAELNAIHPFREGNGRTQLTFLTLLADRAGHSPRPGENESRAYHAGCDCELWWPKGAADADDPEFDREPRADRAEGVIRKLGVFGGGLR